MTDAIDAANAALIVLFDILLLPFGGGGGLWGLVFVSALCGAVLVVLYGQVSNQKGLADVKRRIHSLLLEAILYRQNLRLSFGAQFRMFFAAFRYAGYALPPLLVLMFPCLLILAQLNLRYDARGLMPGERVLMRAVLREGGHSLQDVNLQAPSGLRVSPALRIAESGEVFWRIEPEAEQRFSLVLSAGAKAQKAEKHVIAGRGSGRLATRRSSRWWLALLCPGERMLKPADAFSEIAIRYPKQRYRVFGLALHWLTVFIVVSIVSGLVTSRVLGIEI